MFKSIWATNMNVAEIAELMDWKQRVSAVYADIRATTDPRRAWEQWRSSRDELFRTHPQSPIPEKERAGFRGLEYFDYDPKMRVFGQAADAPHENLEITTSTGSAYSFTRFARVMFALGGSEGALDAYWLEGYGGGLFLPFRDATAGRETYGAGRYLLDTVKGADLGWSDGGPVLDFNFAFNPSCAYDPRWVCPLAPPANRLEIEIRAGEKHSS